MAHQASLKRNVQVIFPAAQYRTLTKHLFPGDFEEHGAALGAGLAMTQGGPRLLVRDIWLAEDGSDHRLGDQGHLTLGAAFIHRCVTRCRDQRLVYLSVHNHGGQGSVAFSRVDWASHERGYGALLDIAEGMPVGALVLAQGAAEVDLWNPDGSRGALKQTRVLGPGVERLYANAGVRASVEGDSERVPENYARQALFLGPSGQALFRRAKVAVVGLGGVGSLISEYLARLGVGSLVLIDPDRLEASNISRVVGARSTDLTADPQACTLKVDIAERIAREAQPEIQIEKIPGDFAREGVARRVLDCDYIFLAADSMRARLVFNAIVHQYYVPGVQVGTKIRLDADGDRIEAAYSVVRRVRPGEGCLLCNELIDPTQLAMEWKTFEERREQHYGLYISNPSVITFNAVGAAHAVNDFLLALTGIRTAERSLYERYDHLTHAVVHEEPRRDPNCPECSSTVASRLGLGDARPLPTAR